MEPDADPVLLWWVRNQQQFPHLYVLACKYFAAQASQAGEERHLSSAELVFSPLRQNMKPSMLDQILFCKMHLRKLTFYQNLLNAANIVEV